MSSSKYHRLNSFHPFFKIYIYKSVTTFWCLSKLFSWQGAYTIVEIFFKHFMNRFDNLNKLLKQEFSEGSEPLTVFPPDFSSPCRVHLLAVWAGPSMSQVRQGKPSSHSPPQRHSEVNGMASSDLSTSVYLRRHHLQMLTCRHRTARVRRQGVDSCSGKGRLMGAHS